MATCPPPSTGRHRTRLMARSVSRSLLISLIIRVSMSVRRRLFSAPSPQQQLHSFLMRRADGRSRWRGHRGTRTDCGTQDFGCRCSPRGGYRMRGHRPTLQRQHRECGIAAGSSPVSGFYGLLNWPRRREAPRAAYRTPTTAAAPTRVIKHPLPLCMRRLFSWLRLARRAFSAEVLPQSVGMMHRSRFPANGLAGPSYDPAKQSPWTYFPGCVRLPFGGSRATARGRPVAAVEDRPCRRRDQPGR